ncbi:hypothetical protein B0O99DRAFT_690177 [Bisporella sp. PMI_857]|nr:hypothetical protein B0O99DRAFT_690177 [Bisporella sp. PMI_857]
MGAQSGNLCFSHLNSNNDKEDLDNNVDAPSRREPSSSSGRSRSGLLNSNLTVTESRARERPCGASRRRNLAVFGTSDYLLGLVTDRKTTVPGPLSYNRGTVCIVHDDVPRLCGIPYTTVHLKGYGKKAIKGLRAKHKLGVLYKDPSSFDFISYLAATLTVKEEESEKRKESGGRVKEIDGVIHGIIEIFAPLSGEVLILQMNVAVTNPNRVNTSIQETVAVLSSCTCCLAVGAMQILPLSPGEYTLTLCFAYAHICGRGPPGGLIDRYATACEEIARNDAMFRSNFGSHFHRVPQIKLKVKRKINHTLSAVISPNILSNIPTNVASGMSTQTQHMPSTDATTILDKQAQPLLATPSSSAKRKHGNDPPKSPESPTRD